MQTAIHQPPPAATARQPRVGLLVAGILTALLAAALLAGGALALWGSDRADADGFLTSDPHALTTTSPALVSDELDLDLDDAGFVSDEDFLKLRFAIESGADEPVFVGIARTHDVDAYLDGVAQTTMTDVEFGPFEEDSTSYRHATGESRATPPADSSIWVASSAGRGRQAVDFRLEQGDWSVVVMNADGSAGVDVDLEAGAKVPWLDELGWGAVGGGALIGAGAAALLLLAFRRPRAPRPAPAPSGRAILSL